MKKIVILFILISCFASQQAEGQITTFSATSNVVSYLNGNWEWFRSCGGMIPGCSYPSNVGYTRTVKFTIINGVNDSIAYTTYKNNVVVHSGKSKIAMLPASSQSQAYLESIYWEANASTTVALLAPQQDTVTFDDGSRAFDGTIPTYYRLQNVTGIKDHAMDAAFIRISPVPAADKIQVAFEKAGDLKELQFYTSGGQRIVLQQEPQSGHYQVGQLPPGLYFVRVITSSGSYHQRFVKQ